MEDVALERVAFDSSALLSGYRRHLSAGAVLLYYRAYWSSWIVGEFVRKRTEWIAERAASDGCDRAELRRRLYESRQRVNVTIANLSEALRSVDYRQVPLEDLDWLEDPDDWPVMQTARAARADTLVTDNSTDFPPGERRNGILILGSSKFLAAVYTRFPDSEAVIREYLRRA